MFETTTDDILKVFHKTIKRLENHVGDQLVKVDEHDKQVSYHASWRETHKREVEKARAAVVKIRALVS